MMEEAAPGNNAAHALTNASKNTQTDKFNVGKPKIGGKQMVNCRGKVTCE
jgi:hypothetical protein